MMTVQIKQEGDFIWTNHFTKLKVRLIEMDSFL